MEAGADGGIHGASFSALALFGMAFLSYFLKSCDIHACCSALRQDPVGSAVLDVYSWFWRTRCQTQWIEGIS
jgi:hypothetical protein